MDLTIIFVVGFSSLAAFVWILLSVLTMVFTILLAVKVAVFLFQLSHFRAMRCINRATVGFGAFTATTGNICSSVSFIIRRRKEIEWFVFLASGASFILYLHAILQFGVTGTER